MLRVNPSSKSEAKGTLKPMLKTPTNARYAGQEKRKSARRRHKKGDISFYDAADMRERRKPIET